MLKKTLRKFHLVRKCDDAPPTLTSPPPQKSTVLSPTKLSPNYPKKEVSQEFVPRTQNIILELEDGLHQVAIAVSTPDDGQNGEYHETKIDAGQGIFESSRYHIQQAESLQVNTFSEFVLRDSWFHDKPAEDTDESELVQAKVGEPKQAEVRSANDEHQWRDEERRNEYGEVEIEPKPEEEEDNEEQEEEIEDEYEDEDEHGEEDDKEEGEYEEQYDEDEEEEWDVESFVSLYGDENEEEDDTPEGKEDEKKAGRQALAEVQNNDPKSHGELAEEKNRHSQPVCDELREELSSPGKESRLLDLPMEIFDMVSSYLPYYDMLSLALTTRKLFHIYPSPDGLPDTETVAEWQRQELCNHIILHRFLPHRIFEAPEYANFCPYCSVELCPPSCPSALLLDSKTGVFYPASLFPLGPMHPAIFQNVPPEAQLKPSAKLAWKTNLRTFPKDTYSTIWCSHHRCPADLMSSNFESTDLPHGFDRFLHDYNDRYDITWDSLDPVSAPSPRRSRRFARESIKPDPIRKTRLVTSHAGFRCESDRDGQTDRINVFDSVSESHFYDTLCRHCRLPLPVSATELWFGITCTCDTSLRSPERKAGCRTCGIVSVKFTMVEAFRPIPVQLSGMRDAKPFRLTLATEVRVEKTLLAGQLVEKLVEMFPDSARQNLELVRYSKVILPPAKNPKLLIINLPEKLLQHITRFVLSGTRFHGQTHVERATKFLFQAKGAWDWQHDSNTYCAECREHSKAPAVRRKPRSYECACDWAFYLFLMEGCDEDSHYLDDYLE
ncbi:hypothetical protein H072_3934 [Dactylellina haptotyla CBS 200.50]|uniref:F-box domain-containing protein n=1 Tax=Dactylellina haptotyla (strain CBS 200.50) TaxID=1284197 RepID=S8ALW9_DACHA|nr:hypothetical protein H072_3934 [Dactylellina haptotyla CBS 200.50]